MVRSVVIERKVLKISGTLITIIQDVKVVYVGFRLISYGRLTKSVLNSITA